VQTFTWTRTSWGSASMPYDDEDVRAYYHTLLVYVVAPTEQQIKMSIQTTAWWFDASVDEVTRILEQ